MEARKFGAFPGDWVTTGDFVWTMHGKNYFEGYGDRRYENGRIFHLRLKSGWTFLNLNDLLTDPEEVIPNKRTFFTPGSLYQMWRENYPISPKNEFTAKLIQQLINEDLPSESRFYRDLKISGFFVEKESHLGWGMEYVFLHDLGAEVKPADH